MGTRVSHIADSVSLHIQFASVTSRKFAGGRPHDLPLQCRTSGSRVGSGLELYSFLLLMKISLHVSAEGTACETFQQFSFVVGCGIEMGRKEPELRKSVLLLFFPPL